MTALGWRERLQLIGWGPDAVGIPTLRNLMTRAGLVREIPVLVARPGVGENPSLRRLLTDIWDPAVEEWSQLSEMHCDEDWTEDCQGVAWNGGHWLFSSNGSPLFAKQDIFGTGIDVLNPGFCANPTPKGIFVFGGAPMDLSDDDIASIIPGPIDPRDHLGANCFYEGTTYAPIEATDGTFWILEINPAGARVEHSLAKTADQQACPWCAVDPSTGLLYSSSFDNVTKVCAYDRRGMSPRPEFDIELSQPLNAAQGGCFGAAHHLFITTNEEEVIAGLKQQRIRVYSSLNGHYFGSIPVLAVEGKDNQELEGLCYASVNVSGQDALLHVVLLENITIAKDNIFFKHFGSSTYRPPPT